MTAKQKAARLKFKKVVAEASKLRKKNPKLTQAQAVKQAWAIESKSSKPKKVGYSKERTALLVKATPYIKKYKKKGYSKKEAIKNGTLDAAYLSGTKKVAAIKIIEKGESKKTRPSATYQQVRTKKGTYKGLKKVGAVKKSASKKLTGYHKDTKSHNVNIRVVSGLPSYKDPDMAREIEFYADSDSMLYFQKRKPILINLSKKFKKGTYDIDKAAKLWRYYIDAALEKYNKEFGSRGDKWYELMSVADRNLLALEYAKNTKEEFELGNFTEK